MRTGGNVEPTLRGGISVRPLAQGSSRFHPRPASFDVSGSFSRDTLWDADTVRVIGDIQIDEGATLEVAPGVRVEFQGYYAIEVRGRILAVGAPESPILFTSAHPELFTLDSLTAGCWRGIRFENTRATNGTSRLEHCRLEYAKGVGADPFGGALSLYNFSNLEAVNCVLTHNAADYGAAAFCSYHSSPRFIGCLFTDNYAFVGGAVIHSLYSYPVLTNCTLVGNDVLNGDMYYGTGAVQSHISKPVTGNSVIWRNSSAYFVPTQLYLSKGFYTTYSSVEGGHEGVGNLDTNPGFLFSGDHPFRLAGDSPCVDAGAPDTTGLLLPPVDLAGDPRLQNGRIDMGAYESALATGIVHAEAPLVSGLGGNRPNPFNPATTIAFSLSKEGRVSLVVHDISGRVIAVLLDEILEAGEHVRAWDGKDSRGRDLGSGVYLVRMVAGNLTATRKIVLLR